MSNTLMVTARVERGLARTLERTAREDDRSRSGQLAHLLRIGLAGRERLKELERLAAAGLAQHPESARGTAAAAAHLRQHAELCGIEEDSHGE